MPANEQKSLLRYVPLIAAAGLIVMMLSTTLAPSARSQAAGGAIDYDGFLRIGADIAPFRDTRLVDLDTFNAMTADPNTIVIDARSADNFLRGHIDGAVNLPFPDFTAEKLAHVIGRPDRRILIYCNNNFSDDIVPVMLKSAPLALNIPTFINLYGYGYTNIYELSGSYSISEPAVGWTSGTVQEN